MKINSLFEKSNIIYANNGSGKTTFTAILKSLQSGKPKVISSRKTKVGQRFESSKARHKKGSDSITIPRVSR